MARGVPLVVLMAMAVASVSPTFALGPFSSLYRPESDLTHAGCGEEDCGEEVDLKAILEAEGSSAAQAAAQVHGLGDITSFAGFLPVNETYDSNMFFWFFPSQDGNAEAPLLIWLQGGPGGSSNFGLFSEMGPWYLTPDLKPMPRPVTWNKHQSMLFIDNPIGAGFSYTEDDAGYCTNEEEVADNLFNLLNGFYKVFPEQKPLPLYITGESYGGHYVPAMAYKIHENPDAKINLQGIAVGDGWIDPVEMIPAYPDMMFNQGLIDEAQQSVIRDMCDQTVTHIKAGEMLDAFDVWDQMLNGDVFPYPNLFHNYTGSNDYDNFLNTNAPAEFSYWSQYVNLPDVRKAIHVGNRPLNDGSVCEKHLLADFMVSMKPRLPALLENYKVLFYSGQLDVIIGAALTERFIPTVEWTGQEAYIKASRMVWRMTDDDPEVAGYVRVVQNFTQVVIRGAGHIAPYDQPERTYDMIQRLVYDIPYKNLPNPM